MTTIIEYQCDICKQKYQTEQKALKCEEQGWFDESMYPAGLMWEHHHDGYVGIFAFPENVTRCTSMYSRGHLGASAHGTWACRAPGYPGDSLGEERCGGNDYYRSDPENLERFREYHYIDKHLNGPEFRRMVKFLKSQGITPSYYDKNGKLITVQ